MQDELKKFGYAFRGLRILFTKETHAKVHAVIAIAVIVAGLLLHISQTNWAMISIAIALVIGAEAFNTAIEKLCDVAQPEIDPRIRDIKDIAAGAVLCCAIIAVVIGIIIFGPYLW